LAANLAGREPKRDLLEHMAENIFNDDEFTRKR